jgi:hypothetical protein
VQDRNHAQHFCLLEIKVCMMEPVWELVRSVKIDAGKVWYTLNLHHKDFSALYPGMIRYTVIVMAGEQITAVFRTNSFEYSPLIPLAAENVSMQIADE